MLNHVRTLLLNRDGDKLPGFGYPGEQPVDADFRELALPTYLNQLRGRLFGADPDRAMLNYRLWQLMHMIHATEVVEYATDLDSRITYDDSPNTDLYIDTTFMPTILQTQGAAGDGLHIQGSGGVPDESGRSFFRYKVEFITATSVRVTQTAPINSIEIDNFVKTDGLSDRIDLQGSGYGFLLSATDTNTEWIIELFQRPTWELGDIAVSIESIGEPVLIQLFGVSLVEPYKTFRNLWFDHAALPYRLAGLVMAMAYRTEEIRTLG